MTPACGGTRGVASPRAVLACVKGNGSLIPGIHEIVLLLPEGWGSAKAGQFVQLECPPSEPFGLRRPFSLASCRAVSGGMELRIVYGVVGARTAALARARKDDLLPLIGPLGRPFTSRPGRRSVLLGGGRGLAPVLMFAEELIQGIALPEEAPRTDGDGGAEHRPSAGNRADPTPLLLHGARTAAQLLPVPEIVTDVRLATDDGSAGFHGTVVELAREMLERGEIREGTDALFACGPNRMLGALATWAGERDLPCQVSLETHFGCGLGICAGCAIPVRPAAGVEVSAFERFIFLCREGPVMDAGRVDWAEVHA